MAEEIESLSDRILRHEGLKLVPYKDSLGFWTIGCGHLLSRDECENYKNGITTTQAVEFLEKDIETAKLAVARELPWTLGLSDIRKDILTEMCFQLGINGLLRFKKMLSCARDGDNEGVVANMLDSQWYEQTPGRCEELAKLWGEQHESDQESSECLT